jgi:nucleolar protein 56
MKNSTVMQNAMNLVMTDIGVEDPTAIAAEDVEMADGITASATEQAVRKEKKDKKEKKKKKSKA